MSGQTTRFSNGVFAGVLAAGIAVGAWHVTLGLYHVAVIVWLMTGLGATVLATEFIPAVARAFRRELALVERLPKPDRPLEVRVVAATGRCVWGYHEQDRWAVDAQGRLTPKLCWAAASALALAGNGNQEERQVACQCPLAERKVSFAVGPAAVAA